MRADPASRGWWRRPKEVAGSGAALSSAAAGCGRASRQRLGRGERAQQGAGGRPAHPGSSGGDGEPGGGRKLRRWGLPASGKKGAVQASESVPARFVEGGGRGEGDGAGGVDGVARGGR
nr:glycine-rich cell wall structural protein 1.0-like [Lolium perenne]